MSSSISESLSASLIRSSLLLALGAGISVAAADNTAVAVVGFRPGTGAAVGYDQADAVLGSPARVTPGEFGGPVDPFSPPWQPGQLLSIGTGGQLTVRLAAPIRNEASHAYGLDFLVFGSSGFVIVNGDFTGGGVTDGSLFGDGRGDSVVSVSTDGSTFFRLDPARSPALDRLFPTDGLGDFTLPVDPSLDADDFNNLGLTGIRGKYGGSGGGVGFDLGWAIDDAGNPVLVQDIEYVRFDVLSDRIEIDAIVAVPEPSTGWLLGLGALVISLQRSRRNAPVSS